MSEPKLPGLWNGKIPEERAIRVSQQLAEGTSLKGTARLTTTHPDTVRRLAVKFGHHADRFHDQQDHRPQTRKALASWTMAVYNWVRSHRSLRQKLAVPESKRQYQQRTPAMALGLTQHIWREADVLRTPVYP